MVPLVHCIGIKAVWFFVSAGLDCRTAASSSWFPYHTLQDVYRNKDFFKIVTTTTCSLLTNKENKWRYLNKNVCFLLIKLCPNEESAKSLLSTWPADDLCRATP